MSYFWSFKSKQQFWRMGERSDSLAEQSKPYVLIKTAKDSVPVKGFQAIFLRKG